MEIFKKSNMKGYKGFRKGLSCRGYQFKENAVFEEEKARLCRRGFHFCKNPFDVLDYYHLVNLNGEIMDFAAVEALDECFTDDDVKYCTKKIHIGKNVGINGFMQCAIDYLKEITKVEVDKEDDSQVVVTKRRSKVAVSEDNSQVIASGDLLQVATSGNNSKIVASGIGPHIATCGDDSKITSNSKYSIIATSGFDSKVAVNGYNSQVAVGGAGSLVTISGNDSQVATSGNNSKIVASGVESRIATSGYISQVAVSGDDSQVAAATQDSRVFASGNNSRAVTSGEYSRIVIGGNNSIAATIGYKAKTIINGANSVGASLGPDGRIKGVIGSWITLAEYQYDEDKDEYICICVKSAQIDGILLKPDTWYILKDGQFEKYIEDALLYEEYAEEIEDEE